MALYSRELDLSTQHTDGLEEGYDPNDQLYELSEDGEDENDPSSSMAADDEEADYDEEEDQQLVEDEGFASKHKARGYLHKAYAFVVRHMYRILFFLLLALAVYYYVYGVNPLRSVYSLVQTGGYDTEVFTSSLGDMMARNL